MTIFQRRKLLLSLLLGASVALSGGCSSIINGTTEQMNIHASPDTSTIKLFSSHGALVREANGSMSYELKRSNDYFKKASYSLEVSSPGYKTSRIDLKTSLSGGWYLAGNIVLGGLIGWLIVDRATGGMWAIQAPNGQDLNGLVAKVHPWLNFLQQAHYHTLVNIFDKPLKLI